MKASPPTKQGTIGIDRRSRLMTFEGGVERIWRSIDGMDNRKEKDISEVSGLVGRGIGPENSFPS